jgi:sulfoxide reductase heme-binding subunit YedZ
MLNGLLRQDVLPMDLLHPSGELSVRLMVLAMLPGPLIGALGPNPFLRTWLSVRRNLGVAAFAYALLHLVIYVIDMRSVAAMLDELGLLGIWTGWVAMFAMIPPAAISFDKAMRRLGRNWKRTQRLVYLALAFALAHWLLLDWDWRPAVIHFLPLGIAWLLRALRFPVRWTRERTTV